jgi:hypothetical protein
MYNARYKQYEIDKYSTSKNQPSLYEQRIKFSQIQGSNMVE